MFDCFPIPDGWAVLCLAVCAATVCVSTLQLNRARRYANRAAHSHLLAREARRDAVQAANTARAAAGFNGAPRLLPFPCAELKIHNPDAPTVVRNPLPFDAPDWREENPPQRGA